MWDNACDTAPPTTIGWMIHYEYNISKKVSILFPHFQQIMRAANMRVSFIFRIHVHQLHRSASLFRTNKQRIDDTQTQAQPAAQPPPSSYVSLSWIRQDSLIHYRYTERKKNAEPRTRLGSSAGLPWASGTSTRALRGRPRKAKVWTTADFVTGVLFCKSVNEESRSCKCKYGVRL